MQHRTQEVHEDGFSDTVFVCTNARDSGRTSCADAHGGAVCEAVKSWLRQRDVFWSDVAVVETGCLGHCSAEGTAIAIHPRSRWYSDVRPKEVPDLLRGEFGAHASRLGRGGEGDGTNESTE